jgi:hypothetical protein
VGRDATCWRKAAGTNRCPYRPWLKADRPSRSASAAFRPRGVPGGDFAWRVCRLAGSWRTQQGQPTEGTRHLEPVEVFCRHRKGALASATCEHTVRHPDLLGTPTRCGIRNRGPDTALGTHPRSGAINAIRRGSDPSGTASPARRRTAWYCMPRQVLQRFRPRQFCLAYLVSDGGPHSLNRWRRALPDPSRLP